MEHGLCISPIGAFSADNGLHSLVVRTAGVIQNQHTRKSSPLTKDSRPPRNKKDEDKDLDKTGDSRVGKATVCLSQGLSVKIDTGTCSPRA